MATASRAAQDVRLTKVIALKTETPFWKDIHSIIPLFSALLFLTLLWLEGQGMPGAWIGPIWLVGSAVVGCYVLIVEGPKFERRRRDAAKLAGGAPTDAEVDAARAQTLRGIVDRAASLSFGCIVAAAVDVLTRHGVVPALRPFVVPIAFLAIGLSYVVIRRLRRASKLPRPN